jgi:hypothetical protein
MMNGSCFRNRVLLFAAVIGAALIAVCPGHAQTQDFQVDLENRQETAFEDLFVARIHDQADELLGATLQPVSDALRTQLNIPAGQGLLVASLRGDGPSAQVGLQQNDVLLTLADKPLAAADDLSKHLRAAGEAAVALKILRAGKPITLQVRPIYRVTLGPVAEPKPEYYIGISIEPIDDALRAQLALPAGQGVIVTTVLGGSPADKAGVKKHDVVLQLADKPIDKPETLARLVQDSRDKQTTLQLLRGGTRLDMPITGAPRPAEATTQEHASRALRYMIMDQSADDAAKKPLNYRKRLLGLASNSDMEQRLIQIDRESKALDRIEAIEKELKALHDAINKLNENLNAQKPPKR